MKILGWRFPDGLEVGGGINAVPIEADVDNVGWCEYNAEMQAVRVSEVWVGLWEFEDIYTVG